MGVMWHFVTVMPIYNILISYANGSVGFADMTGTAYKLRLSDGKLLWKVSSKFPASFSTGGAVLGPNGVLYVTSNDGIIEMFDKIIDPSAAGLITALNFTTGQELWH